MMTGVEKGTEPGDGMRERTLFLTLLVSRRLHLLWTGGVEEVNDDDSGALE